MICKSSAGKSSIQSEAVNMKSSKSETRLDKNTCTMKYYLMLNQFREQYMTMVSEKLVQNFVLSFDRAMKSSKKRKYLTF